MSCDYVSSSFSDSRAELETEDVVEELRWSFKPTWQVAAPGKHLVIVLKNAAEAVVHIVQVWLEHKLSKPLRVVVFFFLSQDYLEELEKFYTCYVKLKYLYNH